jgi:N-acetylmuramoyl-L-alanine amidase
MAIKSRIAGCVFAAALIVAAGGAQARPQGSFVRLIVPEADTVHTQSSVYRLSAGTNPGNRMTLNGTPLKAYPSGGCAGLLKLTVGDNPFTLVALDGGGNRVASKSFLVVRDTALATSPAVPLQIDSLMMQPGSDVWLDGGDLLEVQTKGSPGAHGTFLGVQPLTEVPPREAGGVRGVYRGIYRVERSDTMNSAPILFRLTDTLGQSVERASRGRVSFKGGEFPRVAVTRADRAALGFGLGEDRLGSAKMSYLVPGVRCAITGKRARQYRVALAPGREAWIAEDAVELLPRGTHPPSALTGTWNVNGDDRFDYVFITLPEKLPYASFQESDPSRIVVEIFGASSNTNWVIQTLTTREIVNVSCSQPSTGVVRASIALKHRQIWGYEISYVNGGMQIKVRRQPERLKIKALTFALDAGHGGTTNKGSLGSTGTMEKDINLAMVRHLKVLLEDRGARVILTRTGDEDVPNAERLRKILASPADILISVHANSIGLTSNPEETRGTGTYYKYPCYRSLSLSILKEILKSGLPLNGNVGSFNFALNAPTELPNVLVELAFLSNPEDEMKLLDDDFRMDLARRIVDGVDEFLDSCDQ